MSAWLDVPSKVKGALVSCAVLALMSTTSYVFWTRGYPRMFWSHSALDTRSYSVELAKRLIERANAIQSMLQDSDSCKLRPILMSTYAPALSKFAEQCGTKSSDGEARTHNEVVSSISRAILSNTPSASTSLRSAFRIASTSQTVAPCFDKLSDQLTTSEVQSKSRRAACAIADVRYICRALIPQVSSMHIERLRVLSLQETVQLHLHGDLRLYIHRVKAAFSGIWKNKKKAKIFANSLFSSADSFATMLITGRREHFIGRLLSPFKIAFKLIGVIFSLIGPISKILITVMTVVIDVLDDIAMLLMMAAKGIARAAQEFRKGLIYGLASILAILVGLALKILLLLLRTFIRTTLTWLFVTWYPALLTAWLTVTFIAIAIIKIVLGILDHATSGSLRHLACTDNHPEAWWRVAGHEQGNTYARNVVCWTPCAYGYRVAPNGFVCERVCPALPRRSPPALLMRAYVWGRFHDWGRKVPTREASVLDEYQKLCTKDYARILGGAPGPFIRDLVSCIVYCHKDVIKRPGQLSEEIVCRAKQVLHGVGPPEALQQPNGKDLAITSSHAALIAKAVVAIFAMALFHLIRSRSQVPQWASSALGIRMIAHHPGR